MKIKLLVFPVLIVLLITSNLFAIGPTARKFNFEVKIAASYFKRGNFKGCRTRVDKALKLYQKLDQDDRSNSLVKKNKIKLDKINKDLIKKGFNSVATGKNTKATSNNKLSASSSGLSSRELKTAKSYASRFARCLKELERNVQQKWLSSALTSVKKGKKLYAKIPQGYRNNPELAENKKKFDELDRKVNKVKNAENKARAAQTKEREEGYAFNSDYSKIEHFLSLIKEYKNVNNTFFVGNVTSLFKGFENYRAQCDNFLKRYRARLEAGKITKRSSLTAKEVIDIITHKDKYRMDIAKTVLKRAYDNTIKDQKNIINNLKNKRKCYNNYIKAINSSNYKINFRAIRDIIEFCNTYSIPKPTAQFKDIDSYQSKIKAILNQTAQQKSFNKSSYPITNDYMKQCAIRAGKTSNLELIYVGHPKMAAWKITKNALGIPLYKTVLGMALYHKKGDNFYRAKPIVLKRVYNGGGYEKISNGFLRPEFYIYKK